MGGGGFQVMRRIPSIKFPLRYQKSSASGSAPRSDVPAAPTNTAVGGESFSSAKAHTCHRQGNRSCSVGWLLVTFSGLTSMEGSVLTFVLPFSII